MTRPSVADLKARAQDRLDDILHRLAAGGKHTRGVYMVCNPMRREKNPSFAVWTQGDACGAFKDFTDPDMTKGDIFGLVAYLNDRPVDDFEFGRRWLEDFLGLGTMTEAEREEVRKARERRRAEAVAAKESRSTWAEKQAFRAWNGGRRILPGSVPWLYLMHRGIDLRFVETYAGDLRWDPRCEYWPDAEYVEEIHEGRPRRRKVRPGPSLPCILTPLRDAGGALRALHYTFLAPDGSGKAEVEKPKLIWPVQIGLVMRVANGDGNHSPEEADGLGLSCTLVLTEGLEDALSVALAAPDLRVWGCASISNFAHAPVDRPCISEVLLHAQNDHGNAAAQATVVRALDTLSRSGKPVARLTAPTGKDLNDTLRGKDD